MYVDWSAMPQQAGDESMASLSVTPVTVIAAAAAAGTASVPEDGSSSVVADDAKRGR